MKIIITFGNHITIWIDSVCYTNINYLFSSFLYIKINNFFSIQTADLLLKLNKIISYESKCNSTNNKI